MSLREIEYADTNAFSKLLIDYKSNKKHFSELISNFPSVDNLKNKFLPSQKIIIIHLESSLVEEINTISMKGLNYQKFKRKILINY